MSGLGTMPLGFGPYGAGAPDPIVEPVTTAVSCRLINTVIQDYVTDPTGNPPPDDGTADRVYLLCSYGDVRPEIITPRTISERKHALEEALRPLTQGQQPAISSLSIEVTPEANGVGVLVRYVNNATSKPVIQVIQ